MSANKRRSVPLSTHRPTRRALFGGLSGVGVAAVLSACTNQANRDPEQPDGAARWRYTDGRGETIELPEPPTRIVSYSTCGGALAALGVKSVGMFGYSPLDQTDALRGVDLTGVATIGEVYGEINFDALLAADPQLIVTAFSPEQDGTLWGFADKAQQRKAAQIAPIVAINGIEDPTRVIGTFEELAASLDAEVDSAQDEQAREEFDAAQKEFEQIAAAHRDIRVLAVYMTNTEAYVARPEVFPQLREMGSWGLQVIDPKPGKDPFWDVLSLENLDTYPCDLLLADLLDVQGGNLDNVATWTALPAVKAGQVVDWSQLEPWSYGLYTQTLTELGAALADAQVVR